jgi:hypothetical protein
MVDPPVWGYRPAIANDVTASKKLTAEFSR